ncbi:MAG: hypothetical protein AMJ56_21045 [Anaerolineae bacterium SG8_19]|jgi:uncharacterized protein (TIRG00374 family)|nr:MAG: hypothetical protein AMJ56_21045 [Anaerolineae bacterium SG8_19]
MSRDDQEFASPKSVGPDAGQFRPVTVRPLHLRLLRYVPTLLLLGLAVHLILPQIVSLQHSAGVIRQMAWWMVALAALAQVASYLGSGYLMQSLVSMTGQRLSLIKSIVITLSAYSVGLVAGGMVGNSASAFRWLKQGGVSAQSASLASTLPPLINNLLLLFLAFFGLIHLLLVHEATLLEEIAFALILFVDGTIVLLLIWGIAHPAQLTRLIDRFSTHWDRLFRRQHDHQQSQDLVDQILNTWAALRQGGWRGPTLGTLWNTGFDLLTLYLLFMASGYRVGFGLLLTGYGLPLLLGKVGFLPGGVGIVEGTMVALYTGLSVPAAIAVVVVLAYRVLSFWIPTLLGFPLVPFLERSGRKKPVIQ